MRLELLARGSGELNAKMGTDKTEMTEVRHGEAKIVTANEEVDLTRDRVIETGMIGNTGGTTVDGTVTVIATGEDDMMREIGTRGESRGPVLREGTGIEGTIHDIRSDGDLGVGLRTTRGQRNGDEWLLHETVIVCITLRSAWILFSGPFWSDFSVPLLCIVRFHSRCMACFRGFPADFE